MLLDLFSVGAAIFVAVLLLLQGCGRVCMDVLLKWILYGITKVPGISGELKATRRCRCNIYAWSIIIKPKMRIFYKQDLELVLRNTRL